MKEVEADEGLLKGVEDLSKYTWTRPTKNYIPVVRGLSRMTMLHGDCMMVAWRAGTACLPKACGHGVRENGGV